MAAPQPCQICAHPKRSLIEIGILHRVPASSLALRFGVSQWAISRHKQHHLSPSVKASILMAQAPDGIDWERLHREEGEGLIGQLVAQRSRLQTVSEAAMEAGDAKGAVQAERAITDSLALLGKLLGSLVQRHEVRHVSILASPRLPRPARKARGGLDTLP